MMARSAVAMRIRAGIRFECALPASMLTVMKGERMRTISHFINGRSVRHACGVTTTAYGSNTWEVQAGVGHGNAAILA
ncbi:MAG: hypothetical protein ABSD59_03885 [Terracidiphilus sp.]